jgi:hypothetical protein
VIERHRQQRRHHREGRCRRDGDRQHHRQRGGLATSRALESLDATKTGGLTD